MKLIIFVIMVNLMLSSCLLKRKHKSKDDLGKLFAMLAKDLSSPVASEVTGTNASVQAAIAKVIQKGISKSNDNFKMAWQIVKSKQHDADGKGSYEALKILWDVWKEHMTDSEKKFKTVNAKIKDTGVGKRGDTGLTFGDCPEKDLDQIDGKFTMGDFYRDFNLAKSGYENLYKPYHVSAPDPVKAYKPFADLWTEISNAIAPLSGADAQATLQKVDTCFGKLHNLEHFLDAGQTQTNAIIP